MFLFLYDYENKFLHRTMRLAGTPLLTVLFDTLKINAV